MIEYSKWYSGTLKDDKDDKRRFLKMVHKVLYYLGPNSHNKLLHFLVLNHGPPTTGHFHMLFNLTECFHLFANSTRHSCNDQVKFPIREYYIVMNLYAQQFS